MTESSYSCSICGIVADNPSFLKNGPEMGGRRYARCLSCGTIQLVPLPDLETNQAFEEEDTAFEMVQTDDKRRLYFERRLSLLSHNEKGGNRLLDVGCSTGRFMALAMESGWDAHGVEMSAELAAEAEHFTGQRIVLGDVMKLSLSDFQPFDAIVALDVIEHVLNPLDFVKRMKASLNSGGQLLLHTPNAMSLRARTQEGEWNMLIPEYHFHLFTPGSLRNLLTKNGFKVTGLWTTSGSGTESGARAVLALIKEKTLNVASLGNGLLVRCKRCD